MTKVIVYYVGRLPHHDFVFAMLGSIGFGFAMPDGFLSHIKHHTTDNMGGRDPRGDNGESSLDWTLKTTILIVGR